VSEFELVALDMAGTTVADGGVVEEAFAAAIDDIGAPEAPPGAEDHPALDPLGYVRRTMGQSKIEVFTALYGDRARASSANHAFEAAYAGAVGRGAIQPIEGAVGAIEMLRAAGVKVCLTTGFSAGTRDAIVGQLDWGRLVDLVLSPSDAGRGRPWPDMILTAVIRLEISGVAPVAVAGDTTSDLLAGSRAGARIVAGVLTGAHSRERLETAPHTHILEDVTELVPLVL
jgi:phosphonatase-like hydrolase